MERRIIEVHWTGLVFLGAFKQWLGIFFLISLVHFQVDLQLMIISSSVPLVLVFVAERNGCDNVSLCTHGAVALVSGDASASTDSSLSAGAFSALADSEGLDSQSVSAISPPQTLGYHTRLISKDAPWP
jgi:hypothetical protein